MEYYNYSPVLTSDDNSPKEEVFVPQKAPFNSGYNFNYNNEFSDLRVDKINGRLLDNIVEYNKNLQPDEVNGTMVNNILKYNNLISVSEFDKMLMARQFEKLKGKTEVENESIMDNFLRGKLLNMSFNDIATKFTEVMSEIMDELLVAYETKKYSLEIITKGDRLIYVGLFMILISFFFYFIHISS